MDGDRRGLRAGHLVALSGALVLVASLWLPWFRLHLDADARGRIAGGAGSLGGPQLAALADGIAAQLDGYRLSAWTAFGGADVLLAAGAALIAAVLLVAGGAGGPGVIVEPDLGARAAAAGGCALAGLVLWKGLSRPLPREIVTTGAGVPVALAGCVLMIAGGLLAGTRRPPRVAWDPPPPAAWPGRPPAVDAARSVPPPRAD